MSDTQISWMKDNTKLIISLGFSAVLVLMFFLVFVGLTQLRSINNGMTRLVEDTYAKTEAAHTMRDAIRLRAISLKTMRMTEDAFERDEEFIRVAGYAGMYRIARERLVAEGMDERESEIHARLTATTRIAQPLYQHAVELLLGDAPAHQVRVAIEAAEREQSVLLDTLDELVSLEQTKAEDALVSSANHYEDTRNTMFALAGATLILGILIAYVVIRQAASRNRQMTYHASHDALTGLVNRREFELRLEQIIDSTEFTGAGHSLLYIDLDQFKVVNDTCGHLAGDELLRQLTKLLQRQRRQTDTLGRLGGDEFAMLLDSCPPDVAARIGETVRERIESFRFSWEGKTFSLSASIGIVPISGQKQSLPDVLSAADSACYMAKQAGRNRIHVVVPGDRKLADYRGEMEYVNRIKQALEQDHFQLFYQIIVSANAPRSNAEHMEILVRMIGEDGELIPPGAFIPAAERYNLMSAVDRWVVEQAAGWLARQSRHLELPTLMINLSGQSISDEHFLSFVLETLNRLDIPPGKICFEITETAMVANLSRAREFIDVLKNLGCDFALDDFGSGFSSFSYLKSLPVDFLKIDGSFVKDILDDPIDMAMVKAINEIGQVLGKKTIAEFVENEAILNELAQLGVDYAQGYGIHRPEPLKTSISRSSATNDRTNIRQARPLAAAE